MAAEVKLTILVDDQGSIKISGTTAELEKLKSASEKAGQGAAQGAAGANQLASALGDMASRANQARAELLGVVGVSVGFAGAIYTAQRATKAWLGIISDGIEAVEDWKSSIIGISAHMTDLSEASVPKEDAYRQWKEYFQWLWQMSKEVDKQVAAGGREIFEIGKEMAKKGVIAQTKEDVVVLGQMMDKLRFVTEGMTNQTGQLHSEIRALFTGELRMTSQLAEAFTQIDNDFAKHYETAVKTGTVFEYLRGILLGMQVASKDMSNTWGSVASTMRSVWQEAQIEAFSNAYERVVALGQRINERIMEGGKLTEDGRRLAQALGLTWDTVAQKVEGWVDYLLGNSPEVIAKLGNMATTLGTIAKATGDAAIAAANLVGYINAIDADKIKLSLGLAAAGGIIGGPKGAAIGAGVGYLTGELLNERKLTESLQKKLQDLGIEDIIGGKHDGALGFIGKEQEYSQYIQWLRQYEESLGDPKRQAEVNRGLQETLRLLKDQSKVAGDLAKTSDKAPPTPAVKPYLGKKEKGGGGGGGGKSPEEEMLQITKRLEDAITHASLERAAMIEKEYANWLQKIAEVGAADEQTAQAMVTAGRWRAAQMDKIEKELTKMAIHETQDRYAKLAQEEAELRKKFVEGVTDPDTVKRFEAQISTVMGQKMTKLAEDRLKSITGLWKQYFDVIGKGDPYSDQTWGARWARLEQEHQDRLRNLTEIAKQFRFSEEEKDRHRRNLDAMYYEDARRLTEEQTQYLGGLYQGMTKAARDYYNESTNMYKQGTKVFGEYTKATETLLMGFFDIIIWRTGKFTDVMTNFLKRLSNALLESLIVQPLVGLISGGLGSIFGGAGGILGGLGGSIGNLLGLGGGGQAGIINSALNAPATGSWPTSGGYGSGGGAGDNAWMGLLGVGGIGLLAAMMSSNEKSAGGSSGSAESMTVQTMTVANLVVQGMVSGQSGGAVIANPTLSKEIAEKQIAAGSYMALFQGAGKTQEITSLMADSLFVDSAKIAGLEGFEHLLDKAGDAWEAKISESGDLLEAAHLAFYKNITESGMSFQESMEAMGRNMRENWQSLLPEVIRNLRGGVGGGGGGGLLGFLGGALDFFHGGGVIRAHSGMVLGDDERVVIGQVEEGILQRPAMRQLGRRNFEALNSGNFDQVDLGQGSGRDARPTPEMHVHVHVHALDGNSVGALDWERLVGNHIAPALKKYWSQWIS